MRKLACLASLILGLLFCLTVSAADAPDISGTLLDASGSPVAGATVQLFYAEYNNASVGRDVGTASTDAEGKFRFGDAFTWTVIGNQPVFRPSFMNQQPRYCLLAVSGNAIGYLNLQQSDGSENVTLKLAQGDVLPVTVVDAERKPIADAQVWVMNSMPRNLQNPKQVLTLSQVSQLGGRTNAEGKLDLLVPAGATTTLAAEKDGYAQGIGQKQVTLQRGGSIAGRVLDPDGEPMAGAKVSYSTATSPGFSGSAVVTDAVGHYELKGVSASSGQVTVSAVHPTSHKLTGSASLKLAVGETATQDITFEPNLEVAGLVVDAETGKPLAGIQLRMYAHPRRGGIGMNPVATTDAAGQFSFAIKRNYSVQINFDEMGGKYLIDHAWQQSSSRGMSVFNTQNLTESKTDLRLPLKLRTLAPLAGKVVSADGQPVAKANVSVDGVPPVTTDAEGSFSIPAAPTDRPGQLTVSAGDLGVVAPFVAGQTQITITALPLVARDCVVTTPEGAPANELSFTLMLQTDAGGGGISYRQVNNRATTITDAEGKCRLEKLIPGAKYMASWSPKGEYGQGNASFVADASEAPIKFIAPKYNHTFFLIVENEDGDPVPDARLQFNNYNIVRNDRQNTLFNLKTDAEGSLRMQEISGGMLEFEIHANGYRQHRASIPVKAGEYVAMLTRQDSAPRHNVLVTSADGKPLPQLAARVFANGKEETALQTDAQGRLEVPFYGRQTGITLLCQHPEEGWGVANMQSYQDGMYTLTLREVAAPRKLRLVTADAQPVPNAKITLNSLADRHSSEGGGQHRSYNLPDSVRTELGLVQVTDANGIVSFPTVDARFSGGVQIQSDVYGNQNKSFQENGSAAGEEIRIQKLAKITGVLIIPTEVGTQPIQYHVQAQPVGGMGGGNGTNLRQDGSFELSIEPGEYRLSAASHGGSSRYMVRTRPVVKLAPGETKTVELEVKEGIPVRGKYIPKGGKMPDSPPKLALQTEENGGFNPKPIGVDGSFEFFVPGPGEYQLLVESEANSYRHHPDLIKVPSEQPVENLVIRGE